MKPPHPRRTHQLGTSWHLAKHLGTEHLVRRGLLRSQCDPETFEGLIRGPQNYPQVIESIVVGARGFEPPTSWSRTNTPRAFLKPAWGLSHRSRGCYGPPARFQRQWLRGMGSARIRKWRSSRGTDPAFTPTGVAVVPWAPQVTDRYHLLSNLSRRRWSATPSNCRWCSSGPGWANVGHQRTGHLTWREARRHRSREARYEQAQDVPT